LRRLLPLLEREFAQQADPGEWQSYVRRLKKSFPRLFSRLYDLYHNHYDFYFHVEAILKTCTEMWLHRPAELKALDAMREADPLWYQSQRMIGAMCYVDLFAGDLQRIKEKIPYLTEMNITYLHLMPLFKAPEGDNDGGYAISSYRDVQAELGTMEELAELATHLRHHGISLCLDFIFNHTSDEHEWAKQALRGNTEFQRYYRMYPDRTLPDQFERSLPEVFPDEHPGAFTYRSKIGKWVWTTFHNYQWDLNYENPEVFTSMLAEMLFLANQGVEILRLDAVAFIWKKLGTACQNLPQAHWIIQAFNVAVQMAAPAMIFKSEAIVHPDEVKKYISFEECQISYNPQLMALLWNSLATREVKVLSHAMARRFAIPSDCEWVNYVRCHDDIGWAFSDEDIAAGGFDPHMHRNFLTRFYTGRIAESFARGQPFQIDPVTGDGRVSGTCASLAGLEQALHEGDEVLIDLAVRRVLLIHGIIMTIGGIPLVYLGDEVALENDYSYKDDPEKASDSRWLHRFGFDWNRTQLRSQTSTPVGRVYQGLLRLIQIRLQNSAFNRGSTEIINTGSDHVFGFFRNQESQSVLVLANFTERDQVLSARHLRQLGLRRTVVDQLAGRTVTAAQEMALEPYQLMILARTAT
jgi:amylosucrase/maltose alpha-D-glucosyltransferase/alpha-amylase